MTTSEQAIRRLLQAGWEPKHVAERFGLTLAYVQSFGPKQHSTSIYFPTELSPPQEEIILEAWDRGCDAFQAARRAKTPVRLAAAFLSEMRPDYAGLIGGRRAG